MKSLGRRHRTSRTRTRIIVPCLASVAAVTALMAGCAENATEPTDEIGPSQSLTGFDGTVSEPVAAISLAASSKALAATASLESDLSLSSASNDSVSFVSLQPGSLPEVDSVRVVNRSTGNAVSVPIVDGGFDPVPIPASVGDTLEIVPFAGTVAQTPFVVLVPPRRPPVVVRTDPPDRKTKVPLNASLLVVFSEPIASGTVVPNVRLLEHGTVVPADVTLDSVGLRAEVRPHSPLLGQTEYTLVIDTGVTDLSGDPLEEATVTTFSTISGSTMVQLTAGRDHTCGLTVAGLGYCWGSNEYGQLGDGAGGAGVEALAPVPVAGGHVFTMLAAGTYHTCGLTVSGAVLCWGRNDWGQLGDGSQTDHAVPARVAGSDVYVAVTAGVDHTCARSTTSTYCWGLNVGNAFGDFTFALIPRQIETSGGLRWTPIAHDTTDGNWCPANVMGSGGVRVFCWGHAPEERAVLDLATMSIYPLDGGAFPRTLGIAIDPKSECRITVGGGAWCTRTPEPDFSTDFQDNNGLGVEVCIGSSCSVPGFGVSYWQSEEYPWETQVIFRWHVVSGQRHSCALTSERAAYCWGVADRGQLGRPATDLWDPYPPLGDEIGIPEPVLGNLSFATLAAGEYHTCGVTLSGETYCWGANEFGQLGDGTRADRYEPVRVNNRP